MNSTLTLIYGSPVLPERNFKVPSLNDIISTAEAHQEIQEFQYIKHALDLTIKINLTQYNLEFNTTSNLNYIIIQNNSLTSKPIGYFVIDKKWVAESTIELTLHCDVVNTFVDDCELSDKTKILRQHKDRFDVDEYVNPEAHVVDMFNHSASEYEKPDYDVPFLCAKNPDTMFPPLYNGVILFDLSLDGVAFEDEEGSQNYYYADLLLRTAQMNFRLYWVDEDFYLISELFESYEYSEEFGYIDYSDLTGKPVGFFRMPTLLYPDGIYKEKPSNAKYLAISIDVPSGMIAEERVFGIRCYHYDEYEEFQQHQMYENINYNYIKIEGDWDWRTRPTTRYAKPKIDFYSEGITPQLYGIDGGVLEEDKLALQQSWYLIYKNQNNPSDSLENPINVFLCGEKAFQCQNPTSENASLDGDYLKNWFFNTYGEESIPIWPHVATDLPCLLIPYKLNVGGTIVVNGYNLNDGDPISKTYTITNAEKYFVIGYCRTYEGFAFDGIVYAIEINEEGEPTGDILTNLDLTITLNGVKTINTMILDNGADVVPTYLEAENARNSGIFRSGGTPLTISPITTIDRTDPKLIKIIKLPYCPANITISNDGYGYIVIDGTQWDYDAGSGMLKLKKFDTQFNRWLRFVHNPTEPLKPYSLWEGEHGIYPREKDSQPYIFYETKLFHSDYYYEKYFYDSFSFMIQLEYMSKYQTQFNVSYQVCNTTNSRFMFTMHGYETEVDMVDFNKTLYVSRNNEIALFNQQYVNYIRNGYNYDKKSYELTREETLRQQLYSVGGSTANTMVRSIKQGLVDDYLGMANTFTSFGFNTASRIYADTYSLAQKSLSLEAKKNQLRNQATGIIDANDIDLLSFYGHNRLLWKQYRCSEKMRNQLFKMFYYTGYVADILGVPDTTSRIYFNYVQAEVVFKKVPNLPQNYINEIKQKYNEGITFLHNFNGVIDFDQKYENWETAFLPFEE